MFVQLMKVTSIVYFWWVKVYVWVLSFINTESTISFLLKLDWLVDVIEGLEQAFKHLNSIRMMKSTKIGNCELFEGQLVVNEAFCKEYIVLFKCGQYHVHCFNEHLYWYLFWWEMRTLYFNYAIIFGVIVSS